MRYYANPLRRLFAALLMLVTLSAGAAGIGVHNPLLAADDEGYTVSADFDFNFNHRLEEAVNRGVVLYFVVDFELTRPRSYWFEEKIMRRSRTLHLSYHALTRQYRLSTGGLHQSYASLDEALRVMSRLRNWEVAEKDELKADLTYQAALRMRLDLTQMPKTFQVGAMANRDWNLSSDWLYWNVTPKEAPPNTSAAISLPPAAGTGIPHITGGDAK